MRSAIVGCGNIAQVHGKAIAQLEQGCLAAVADSCPEAAERLAAAYGAKPYSDLETMLREEAIDVLHICTPHYLHVPMAAAALERGVHVFLEKPPAMNRRQWEQLREAAGHCPGGTRIGVCFQNRYNGSVGYVKEQLGQGVYGGLLGARGFVTWRRDQAYYASGGWRGRKETEGGGVLINQAIHTLDLLQYFMGERALAVEAVMDRQHLPDSIEVEDTAALYMDYPRGRACLYASNSYVSDVPPIIELECEKARVRIEDTRVTVYESAGEIRERDFREKERPGKSYWGAGHFSAIREFYRCVLSGERFFLELEDVENTMELMFKAYESAGRRV